VLCTLILLELKSNKCQFDFAQSDLVILVRNALCNYQKAAQQRKITIKQDFPPEVHILMDDEHISYVFNDGTLFSLPMRRTEANTG